MLPCSGLLMCFMATIAPHIGGMTNNSIKRHLVLHLCEDILDHGIPDNVNSAYAEPAHITLAKITSRNTQKRAISFTKQAAHRYVENLVVSLASTEVKNNIKMKETSAGLVTTTAPALQIPFSNGKSGRDFTYHGLLAINLPHSSCCARDHPMIWRWPVFLVQ